MPSGQARHGPSASQSQPKIGPGSILTAQVPHNRKKAKRRAKEAAKKAAEQTLTSEDSVPPPPPPPPPPTAAAAATTMMKAATPMPAPSSSVGRNGTAYNIPGAFEQNSLDSHAYHPDDLVPDDAQDEYEAANEEYYLSDAETPYQNDRPVPRSKSKKKKKKNRGGSVNHSNADDYYDPHHPYSNSHPPPPPPPPNRSDSDLNINNERHTHSRIWNTSGAEERENIKTFWLALDEAERRSLVKVEKEAVLKKMKEQQKHSCSCSVCGRKRIAIEEELEVLYDAYYEELEQYANHKVVLDDGTVITGPEAARAAYSSVPARLPPFVGQNGFQSRFHEEVAIEEDDEPDGGDDNYYNSEDDDEEYDDDEGYDDEPPPPQATNFLNFGQSLTVRGGILTVADDLLKNDGKKFIEMMEQLAERRMRREEEAQYAETANMRMSHAHTRGPPLDEDEGYEDDEFATEEEGYPEDDLDDDELDDEDAVCLEPDLMVEDKLTMLQEDMTEEQRMEEGRRMFQIFAARMFEQRVLTAYREKVARERQEKLLEELEDEKDQEAEKEAQKARKLAKAKEKKLRLKMQKEEEKAKKDAEKQASIDAAKAEEERKAEEQRKKKEEQKKKREEEKRRQDEERTKKEDDKKRKLAEAKKLQEEQERKLREQKDREKQKREEVRKREQEEKTAKVAKEKELKERKEREAVEKRERDTKAKAERLAQTKKAEQAKALLLQQQQQQQPQQIQSQQSPHQQPHPASVAPMLRKQTSNASVPSAVNLHNSAQASPHLQIATPVIPKAPSPQQPRQASQQGSSVQGSHQSSPKSGQVPSGSSATSPSTTQQVPVGASQSHQTKNNVLPSHLHHHHHHHHQQQQHQHQPPPLQPPVQNHGQPLAPPPGMPYPTMPAPGLLPNGFQSGFAPQTHVQHPRYPPGHDPAMFGAHGFGGPYRGFNPPHSMPYPPGMNGFRGMSGPPGISSAGAAAPGGHGVFGMHSQGFPQMPGQRTQPHSRQASTTVEKASMDVSSAPAQPIAPPAPIKRPSSSGEKGGIDQADESKQLGSSALLDDDAPIDSLPRELQGGSASFNSAPLFQEPFRGPPSRTAFGSSVIGSPFNSPYVGHNAVTVAGNAGWGGPTGPHFGGSMFAAPTAQRHQSRPVWLRMLAIEACNRLSKSPHLQATQQGGFHSIEAITNEVNAMKGQNEPIIPIQELLDICDTEGNAKNGGGTFVRTQLANESIWIKFENDAEMPPAPRHSVGDIGSPLISHASPAYGAPAPGFGGPRFAAPGSGVSGF